MKLPRYLVLVAPIYLAACVTTSSKYVEHFAVSDKVSKIEDKALLNIYKNATDAFGNGDISTALREYEYAAYRDSTAAELRLCVIYGYGVGVKADPLKSLNWCRKVYEKGYKPAKGVMDNLYEVYWPEQR